MTELIHGLVSGLIWSAILGSCLIAIAAVITATASVSGRVSDTAAGTARAVDESPIPLTPRPVPTAILCPIRPVRSKWDKKRVPEPDTYNVL
jgi:hypothetical protein